MYWTGLIYNFFTCHGLDIADFLPYYHVGPGGYVQWDEHDHVSQKVVTADPAIDPKTVHAMLDFVKPFDDMMGPQTFVPSPSTMTSTKTPT